MTDLTEQDLFEIKKEKLQRLRELRAEKERLDKYQRWDKYVPYEFQKDYFDAGKEFRTRFLCAGNRVGKTFSMAHEVAYHLTGLYPDWWDGYRFSKPILCWAVGITGDSTKKVMQKELFGTESAKVLSELGTGTIPREYIQLDKLERDGNKVLVAKIKHVSGEYSTLEFRSTQQGEHALMGATVDFIWLDEEDPHRSMEIFAQCKTRVSTTKGLIAISATPENGVTRLVDMFQRNTDGKLWFKHAGWDDCGHFTEDDYKEMKAATPPNQWPMRLQGIPMVAHGLVYQVNHPDGLESLKCEPFPIPDNWNKVVGIDVGVTHDTAAVWSAYDHENDIIYVYDAYNKKGEVPAYHAMHITQRGQWIPAILPHDADNVERGSGQSVAQFYRKAGLNAAYETFYNDLTLTNGKVNNFVEVGIIEIRTRMNTGRLKILDYKDGRFDKLWEELNQYQYGKDGKPVKERDDSVDAMRYSILSVKGRGQSSFEAEREFYLSSQYEDDDEQYFKW